MQDYDSRLDLAPRDIVARAIHEQMQSRNESHVLLDISYQPRDKILQHFPNIAEQCQGYGLDITRDPIPVAPAQHYMCGGVKVCLTTSMTWWLLCDNTQHVCPNALSTLSFAQPGLPSPLILELLATCHRAVKCAVARECMVGPV